MATYDNAYEILEQIRYGLNEHSTAYVQGTDTSGLYQNPYLTKETNKAQRLIFSTLLKRAPEKFLESASLTGVDSVFTLPWNFGSIVEFKDANGRRVWPAGVEAIPGTGGQGSSRQYYRKGNTLVLTKSGSTDTYTLWFRSQPRDIHAGKAAAGAASSITLDSTYAKLIADYYNGMDLENDTDDSIQPISDYTAARVATITGTGAEDDYYGLVSELPQVFHYLIAPRAVITTKLEHPASQEKPTSQDIQMWFNDLMETLSAWAKPSEDISPEDIWADYGGPIGGTAVPGHSSLV